MVECVTVYTDTQYIPLRVFSSATVRKRLGPSGFLSERVKKANVTSLLPLRAKLVRVCDLGRQVVIDIA